MRGICRQDKSKFFLAGCISKKADDGGIDEKIPILNRNKTEDF